MAYFNEILEKVRSGSILYIDFDDTLVDFCNGWLKNIRHIELIDIKNLPNTKNEIQSFRFFKIDSSGRTEKSLSNPKSYDNVDVMDGAIEFIEKIRKLNIRFKILTTSHSEIIEPIKDKKLKELFNIDKEDIIHTLSKQEIIKGHILIDDAIHNIKNYEEDEETLTIMITQPWNERYPTKYRISSLKELL